MGWSNIFDVSKLGVGASAAGCGLQSTVYSLQLTTYSLRLIAHGRLAECGNQKIENRKAKYEIRNTEFEKWRESGLMLGRTGCGEDQDLAGAEAVGVAQLGIGLGDAWPGGAAAQL